MSRVPRVTPRSLQVILKCLIRTLFLVLLIHLKCQRLCAIDGWGLCNCNLLGLSISSLLGRNFGSKTTPKASKQNKSHCLKNSQLPFNCQKHLQRKELNHQGKQGRSAVVSKCNKGNQQQKQSNVASIAASSSIGRGKLVDTRVLLSVWGQEIISFCVFNFYATSGVILKSMIESSLLSKDEPLTSNIDEVMAV